MVNISLIINSIFSYSLFNSIVFLFFSVVACFIVIKLIAEKNNKKNEELFSLWEQLLKEKTKNIQNENNISDNNHYSLVDELLNKVNLLIRITNDNFESIELIKALKDSLNSFLSLWFFTNNKLHFFNFWYKKSVELLL